MWNDEDNNPYGTSFVGGETGELTLRSCSIPLYRSERRANNLTVLGGQAPFNDDESDNLAFSSTRPEYQHNDTESDSEEDYTNQHGKASPRSYESRILQILHENPELPIQITDAGKSLESGGKYIVYTIRTGVSRSF